MNGREERTRRLIGDEGIEALRKSRVLVFGAGGVGGYVLEALVRSGIGTVGVSDFDTVSPSNLNRQLLATEPAIGRLKTDLFAERARLIDPNVRVICFAEKATPENLSGFGLGPTDDASGNGSDASGGAYAWDYVVDAIDDVPAKIAIAEACTAAGIPFIMSMGTGNRLDPSRLRVADIAKTHDCPLAKAVRVGLRKRGISHAKCVFSEELPAKPGPGPVGSMVFVPASAGLLIASEVVRELIRRP